MRIAILCALLAAAPPALAQQGNRADVATARAEDKAEQKESPWLLVPVFSVSPKLGTSLGAMAGYMHYFDEKSRVSMFGVSAQYTSTGSTVGGLFGQASFGEDHHRLLGGVVGGRIRNNYDDYLGTGVPLKTDDELRALFTRYVYRVKGDWFVGGQAIYTDYAIIGQTAFDQEVLNVLGLQPFRAGGVGLVALYDSRDSAQMPRRGSELNLNNVAYRDWIAGSSSYDVYRLDYRKFWSHGNDNVFGIRQSNHWTVDAPSSALASVVLRGYKQGQYLGQRMSSLEAEERLRLGERWTSTFFVGVACLYGGEKDCFSRVNAYPDWGVGIQYVLKQKEGIVLNLEYAGGKDGNQGLYMKMGYAF